MKTVHNTYINAGHDYDASVAVDFTRAMQTEDILCFHCNQTTRRVVEKEDIQYKEEAKFYKRNLEDVYTTNLRLKDRIKAGNKTLEAMRKRLRCYEPMVDLNQF